MLFYISELFKNKHNLKIVQEFMNMHKDKIDGKQYKNSKVTAYINIGSFPFFLNYL